MREQNVAIIIPVYNEGEVIEDVIDKVAKHFSRVICVDDGSTDNSTVKISKTSAALVKHPLNLGQGAALQTGIEYALLNRDIQYFVTYDADGQHNIEDVRNMLKTIRETKVDIILGSRFLGKAENITWLKKVILKLAIVFSNKTSGIHLTDAHNGLRVFSRRTAEQLKLTTSDFSHASEIIERIASNKLTYQEVPITISYTDYSKQKGQSVLNAVNISFDVLMNKMSKK